VKIGAYRLTQKRFAATIWSGNGARMFGGRWSSKGRSVVYTAQSCSLAALEQLVHMLKPRLLRGFMVASIEIDESRILVVDPAKLPKGWNKPVAPPMLRTIGDDWFDAGKYVVLAVPSAVVEGEWNYLFNPLHPGFSSLVKSALKPFVFDIRLR
jgi:RES domain-containing protein